MALNSDVIPRTDKRRTELNHEDWTKIYADLQALNSIIPGEVATTDASSTELDTIDTLVDNATNSVIINVSCKSDDDAKFGTWIDQLTITKIDGIVTIRKRLTIIHQSSAGLKTKDVSYTANVGNVDIDVTGIAATNIQWNSNYEIKVSSTN